MHAGCRASHDVLAAGLPVVCGTRSGTGLAHVVVVDVAAVGVAVVPILEAFVGSGLHHGALTAAGCLMATAAAVSAAIAATAVVITSVGSTAVGIVVVMMPSATIVCLL